MVFKYLVATFSFLVGIFGIFKVADWNGLSPENIVFLGLALISTFLSGLLFAINYRKDEKQTNIV